MFARHRARPCGENKNFANSGSIPRGDVLYSDGIQVRQIALLVRAGSAMLSQRWRSMELEIAVAAMRSLPFIVCQF